MMADRRKGSEEPIWGTDGRVSLPQSIQNESALKVDMEGFCFTPYGLRVNISEAGREELLRSGYGPMLRGEERDDDG